MKKIKKQEKHNRRKARDLEEYAKDKTGLIRRKLIERAENLRKK